jgi:hypothetical protein
VRHQGIQPISVAWSDDASVTIEGDPFGTAVAGRLGRGPSVARDLTVGPAGDESPRVADEALPLDERGIPRLVDAREWPLEA